MIYVITIASIVWADELETLLKELDIKFIRTKNKFMIKSDEILVLWDLFIERVNQKFPWLKNEEARLG